jgi:flagellar biosynthesis protein FlhB
VKSIDAPRVVAKGVRFLALRIREVAQEHDIPMVENGSPVWSLYKSAEISKSITDTIYKTVAVI